MRRLTLCLAVTFLGCSNRESTQSSKPVSYGCATPAANWAETGVLTCPQSLASYCMNTVHCQVADLSDAFSMQNATGSPPNIYVCGAYHYADDNWGCGDDGEVFFVYETATGKLVAAIEQSSADGNRQACVGGPATVDRLDFRSCTEVFDCFPNDAGYDARHCSGEAGASGGAQ
jgi:hypothetical protein